MNKVFDLYRYLKISGFGRELEILKTALETTPEELEEAFPQLFRFYEEGKPTAMFGGIFAQINKYIEEGYVTQQEIDAIQSFESLKQKMKELKILKKETEAKFKYLNEYNIEQEFKDLAKEKRLSKEDFEFAYKSFISENEDNHQLEQAISEIADLREKYRLLKEKINTIENNEELLSRLADPLNYKALNNASTEINNLMMDVNNIIEDRQAVGLKKKLLNYYDYIYNGVNKLSAYYPEKVRGRAKETSKVLYNDGSWAIVRSWSEEACQYWERGAVRVEGNKVRFNTCTSRIGNVHGLTFENMYKSYSKYTMFQILKLENGEPKFYEGPNEMLTLCFDFDFANNNFKMIQGASASVNADDKNMTKEMVAKVLPENIYAELQDILNSDKKYELLSFKQLLELNIPDEIRSELMLSSLKKLKPLEFFKLKNKIPENLFNFLKNKKVKDSNPKTFFSLMTEGYISDDIFNSLVNEKTKELDPHNFFTYRGEGLIPDDLFNSLVNEKAKRLSPEKFFVYRGRRLISDDLFNSLVSEKTKELNPYYFFMYRGEAYRGEEIISDDLFNSLVNEKAKELERLAKASIFFHFKDNIPEDIYLPLVEKKAKGLKAFEFFSHKEDIPEDIFNSLAEEKARGLRPYDFFDFKYFISKKVFNSLVEKKTKDLDPKYFFDEKISNKIPENIFNSLAEKKAKEFLLNSENIVDDNIIKYFSKHLSAKDFFKYSDKFPKDIFKSFAEEKTKELDPDDFFKYKTKIRRDIFRSLAGEKAKEASPELIFERSNIRALIKSPSLSKEELKDLIISKEKELPNDAKLSYSVISPIRRTFPEVFSDIFRRRYERSDSI